MSSLKSILSKAEYHLSIPKFNIWKSLYINFRLLPFSQAIHFPILIYGKMKFHWLTGRIIFKCPIRKGILKIGKNLDFFAPAESSSILLQGDLVIFGQCNISINSNVRISKNGILEIGAFTFFGANTKIVCVNKIAIGGHTQFAFGCNLMDTNFHYMYNTDTKEVYKRDGEIKIAEKNWFGNNCSIYKGTKTKPFTTVSSHSMTNKDYTDLYGDGFILAGSPAKLLSNNTKRIFSTSIESEFVSNLSHYEKTFLNKVDEFKSFENHMIKQ